MRKKATIPDRETWQTIIHRYGPALKLSITEDQTRLFSIHAAELARWNEKINLTAITDPTETAVKHFLDSLVPSLHIPENTSLLDIGTGGGFPGIPLKVIMPSLSVTLVDATLKKVNFVRQVIRLLSLDDTTAFHGRVESLKKVSGFSGGFDTVICRAFDSLTAFVASTHRLIRGNGRLIAMKGKQAADEIKGLDVLELSINKEMMKARDLFEIAVHEYTLPLSDDQRSLIVLTAKPDIAIL